MVSMRDQEVVATTHELAKAPMQPFVAYATKGCPDRFMVQMRGQQIVATTHKLARGRPARSTSFAPRFSEFERALRSAAAATETVTRRFMVPIHAQQRVLAFT